MRRHGDSTIRTERNDLAALINESLARLAGTGTAVIALLVGLLGCSSAHTHQDSHGKQPSTHYLNSRAPVTMKGLLSAPVPAACTHKAGKLVNGVQPGIPANHGRMALAWLDRGPKTKATLTAFGDLSGGERGDVATVLECNAGGVAWPEIVAFYSPGPTLLGWAYLTNFNLPGVRYEENAYAWQITNRHGGIYVEWSTQDEGDPGAVSSLDYSATLRLSGHKIVASNLIGTTEAETANAFLKDLVHGDEAAASRLAAPTVAATAASQFRTFPSALTATLKCYGLNDTMPGPLAAVIDQGELKQISPTPDRLCTLRSTDPGARWIALGMRHTGFRTWQILWSKVAH